MPRHNKFQIGDVVELMSGGELMTVIASTTQHTTTAWHDRHGHHVEAYPSTCLRRREPLRLLQELSDKKWNTL